MVQKYGHVDGTCERGSVSNPKISEFSISLLSFLAIVKFLYCTFYKSTNVILFIDTSAMFDTRMIDNNC